ncbi:hypothetical protein [Winogradskyella forsetii]|nr:hypothetical protein [Winogradskyella forsetii]
MLSEAEVSKRAAFSLSEKVSESLMLSEAEVSKRTTFSISEKV